MFGYASDINSLKTSPALIREAAESETDFNFIVRDDKNVFFQSYLCSCQKSRSTVLLSLNPIRARILKRWIKLRMGRIHWRAISLSSRLFQAIFMSENNKSIISLVFLVFICKTCIWHSVWTIWTPPTFCFEMGFRNKYFLGIRLK